MCDRAFVTLNVSARVRVGFFSALLDMPLKKEKEKKKERKKKEKITFQSYLFNAPCDHEIWPGSTTTELTYKPEKPNGGHHPIE